ncbi:uracil phosphoribosyltransferase [Artemisia annua]|uniref:Uracil phosphoribosyltransferase n=1 Tax=Artemisia annua TaxID=35608 RepID=A0A2U1NYX9_ARTAN|nr:uracil phosphoribosyltransferase [Artemisia annua]
MFEAQTLGPFLVCQAHALKYCFGSILAMETLEPTVYLNKLPDKFSQGTRVLIVDPMLATGRQYGDVFNKRFATKVCFTFARIGHVPPKTAIK